MTLDSPPQGSPTDDEIDLRDLALMLIEGWYWIVGAVVVAILAAVAYLAIATPTYETRFRAVPASSANFSGFNLLSGYSISPAEAYRTLGNRLSSYQNFQSFFDANRDRFDLPAETDLGSLFSERFSFDGLEFNANDNPILNVRYRYPEGEQGAEILNAYVGLTAAQVWRTLRSRFDAHNKAQIERLRTELALQRDTLKRAREARLFTLDQAIIIARQLEIEKPTTPQEFGRQSSGSEVIYANISGDGSLPLYFMGYQALEADREAMADSMEQGLSSTEIRDTEHQLEQRLGIAELLDSGRLYGVDEGVEPNHTERVVDVVEYAFAPAVPSEPSKRVVLALALVLGGILGMVLVFFMRFSASLRSYRHLKLGV